MKSVLRGIDIYLSELHRGSINIVIHFIGVGIFGYGAGSGNWVLVAIGPLIMELGHVYNYIVDKDRELMTKTIPLQISAWFLFMAIAYVVIEIL